MALKSYLVVLDENEAYLARVSAITAHKRSFSQLLRELIHAYLKFIQERAQAPNPASVEGSTEKQ